MYISLRNKKKKKKLKNSKRSYIKLKQNNSFSNLIKVFIITLLSINFFIVLIKKEIIANKINNNIRSNTTVGMCTLVKKENRYIKYFIEFYKKIGYNNFYFYENNEIEDESLYDLEIIQKGIKEGFITIVDYKNVTIHIFSTFAYNCYEKFNSQNDWISFFDVDEYLILKQKDSTIQEFLDNPKFNSCQQVQFSWMVFNDNDQLDYEDKPLIERFPIQTNFTYINRHVKSIIRGRLDYKKFKKNGNSHSIYNGIKACTSSGQKADNEYYIWPPDYEYGTLNHYVTKSVREYYDKRKRQFKHMSINAKKKFFDFFFMINDKTEEKVKIYNQIFHTHFK